MTIDVSQFHQIFFEESFEGLELMEEGLLSFNDGEPDLEVINTIFRAAHSIKGGAGTFGFSDISAFTHSVETLLDQLRNGERLVSRDEVNVLLQSVDVLRDMLTAARDKTAHDEEAKTAVSEALSQLLSDAGPEFVSAQYYETDEDSHKAIDSVETEKSWTVKFTPDLHLPQTGNDPLRILRELASIATLKVELDDSALPSFLELEPENSYLSWTLELTGDINKDMLTDVFEWVEDDSDIEIVAHAAQFEEKADEQLDADQTLPVTVPNTKPADDIKLAATVAPADNTAAEAKPAAEAAVSSIRVGTDKVDSLLNLVGELVITQSMLSQIGDNLDPSVHATLIDGLENLERNTRELQEGIMRIRMLPISFSFNRFPRLVHDLSQKMNKKVDLRVSGEQTELDKTVMEKIGDPLVHLLRNSLDHGIESPEVRVAAGKPETGILQLNAYQQGGNIIIEISDDGGGLNEAKILSKAIEKGLVDPSANLTSGEIYDLIFLPGFSTADVVSDVSGRGVGMDVVRRNINSLGGSIEVKSATGQGSKFTIRLPLTLAIMDGQIIQVDEQRFIIPLLTIIESVEIKPGSVKKVTGKGEVFPLRNDYIPLVRLNTVFGLPSSLKKLEDGLLVVVDCDDQKIGLLVDELLAQQQVVIKNLESNYRKVQGFAGATILGDGAVALILDIPGIVSLYRHGSQIKHTFQEQVA